MADIIPYPDRSESTIARDLRASLAARQGVPVGSTFGDFIAACRALGIRDDMLLASCEFGIAQTGNGYLTVDVAADGIELREGVR